MEKRPLPRSARRHPRRPAQTRAQRRRAHVRLCRSRPRAPGPLDAMGRRHAQRRRRGGLDPSACAASGTPATRSPTPSFVEPTASTWATSACTPLRRSTQRCELGYWILGDFEGQGYMSEAVRVLEAACFAVGFHRIGIRCSSKNARSAGVPRRSGYTLDGTLRQHALERGERRDTLVFSKLAATLSRRRRTGPRCRSARRCRCSAPTAPTARAGCSAPSPWSRP